MNALKVITLAAFAACGSTQYIGYPGLNYGHHGLHHGYNGLHHGIQQGYTGLLHGTAYQGPYNYAAPYTPIQTQYHSQDELGQYSFGYEGGLSNRAETRDAYGNVRGSYTYVDSNGQPQVQHYVADALGFRVSGTNLPVGPNAPAVAALVAPEPVVDTPEVVKAREEFLALYNEAAAAAAAAAAAPDARKKRSTELAAPEPVEDTPEVAQAKAEFQAAYAAAAAAAEAAPDKGPLEDYAPVYNHYRYAGLHHGYAPLHRGYSGLVKGYTGLHHGLAHHGLTHHGLAHHGLTHNVLPYAYARPTYTHPSRAFSYAHGLTVPSVLRAY